MSLKETEDRRTAVAQMKRVGIIADSLYNRMLRCDVRRMETDIIEISQMRAGLARLGHNLTMGAQESPGVLAQG